MPALSRRNPRFRSAVVGLTIVLALLPSTSPGFFSKKRTDPHRLTAPVFDNQDCPSPNQPEGPCALGNDFTVNPGHKLWVNAMGAFDARGGGLKGDVLVGIYDLQNQRKVAGTFVHFKAPGTSYLYANQSRWQDIAPVLLPPGKYTVIAANYGPSGNPQCASGYSALHNNGESPLRFNPVEGALSMDGGRWLTQARPWRSLPETPPQWEGVRETKTRARPLFAAGSFAVPQSPAPLAPSPAIAPLTPPEKPPHQVPDPPLGWSALLSPLLLTVALCLKVRRRKQSEVKAAALERAP
jgi:hypothetical protein